mmetsp:Transcript_96541/g.275410  ORF Transcript_96541/g.275410 Transcript_96541/m.275410 type:complete len:308 (-) Transcript_96541:388-1311(-)
MPDVTTNVIHVDCDLSSFASVREAAAAVREAVGELDVLCLNAGVMGLLDAATPDGFDVQMYEFPLDPPNTRGQPLVSLCQWAPSSHPSRHDARQPNHLSQFLLTALLWDLLEATADKKGEARVVNHSSGARNAPFLPLTAEYLQKNGGNLGGDGGWGMQKWQRYQQTKLANMVFHYALTEYASARADEGGGSVKVVAAHPGPTNTGLQAKAGSGSWLDNFINGGATEFGHSPEDGAMGIVRASVASDVESGQFYGPEGAGSAGPAVLLPTEASRERYGQEAKALLWKESVSSTGAAWPPVERAGAWS